MTMGQQKDRQGDLMVGWAEMPRSPGHVFYDRLQSVLIEGGFDGFAEAACRNLSTTLRHRRFLFTDSFLLLWKWRVG